MKKISRIIAGALALATSIISLAACKPAAQNNASGGYIPTETVTLDVYSQLSNFSGIQVGWFAGIMLDRFNVKLNIIKETGSTYTTRMEAGDLGDIVVWGSTGQQYQDAVAQGMLLPWDDTLLASHGSYIKENMQPALNHNKDISKTGQTYGFGFNVATDPENHGTFMYSWDLRFDYYKELGYPEIKDLNDLLEVFKEMKKAHPTDDNGLETYAISLWPDWDVNMVMYPKSLATAYYGYDELGLGLYNNETGEFYDALMVNDDGSYGPYLEMIQFFNKLYQEGLLDPDSMTQTAGDASATISSGRTFWSIFNYAGSSVFNTEANIADNKAMYSVCPKEATPCVYGMNVLGGNRVWTISAKTKYPELCLEIINYLSTPKGVLETNYGPEGLCWNYGDDGKVHFTDLGYSCAQDGKTMMASDDSQYDIYTGDTYSNGVSAINNTTWSVDATNPETGERYNWKYWSSTASKPAEGSIEAAWREWTGENYIDDYLENREGGKKYSVAIASPYTEGTKSAELDVIWTQVTKTIVSGSWNAIYSSSDDEFKKQVDTMIKDANSYDNGNGYKKCIEWSQNEADNRKAAEDTITGK